MAYTTTLTAERKYSLYKQAVLGLLGKMELGRLNMNLPDGEVIRIGNGNGINASMNIHSEDFFKKSVLYGDIGFGESYVDGDWDTDNITALIEWFLLNVENAPTISGSGVKTMAVNLLNILNKIRHLTRANSLTGSRKNISEHYDLNNQFFSLFLDETMTYSSGYFIEGTEDLKQAQLNKYNRLCKQLKLKPTDHVLEIGCGWGSMSIYMARNYGCKVTAITISEEQYNYAKERIAQENLTDQVTVLLTDYRNLQNKFDKIVSIEMLEAVGHKYLGTYFSKCNQLLKKNGLLALQVITCPDSRYDSLRKNVDWIQKHIFPGSLLPSVAAINNAINKNSDFNLVDLKDFGLDYGKTLKIWKERFNKELQGIKQLGFDDRFIRKWNYYLSYCEAAFNMKNIYVMQLVYSRPNNV